MTRHAGGAALTASPSPRRPWDGPDRRGGLRSLGSKDVATVVCEIERKYHPAAAGAAALEAVLAAAAERA